MNLAAWKYRNIAAKYGGPIKKLLWKRLIITEYRTTEMFEVDAYLDDSLTHGKKGNTFYGAGDGSGTSKCRAVASYKAISESLERWAFYEVCNSNKKAFYGYDIEPSTTGMAAYPGLTSKQARRNARLDSIERWSLTALWKGLIGIRSKFKFNRTVDTLIVESPFRHTEVVLLHYQTNNTRAHVYAFAAEDSINLAIEKALIELDRNIRVLSGETYKKVVDFSSAMPTLTNIYEKRLLFFSTAEGYDLFVSKVGGTEAKKDRIHQISMPRVVVDSEIKGPWSKYTCVWRFLYEPVSNKHLSNDDDSYFYF